MFSTVNNLLHMNTFNTGLMSASSYNQNQLILSNQFNSRKYLDTQQIQENFLFVVYEF